jgi:hypothetical protein
MRRVLAFLAALALLLGLAPSAAANAALRWEEHRTALDCGWFEGGGGWSWFQAVAYGDGAGWAMLGTWTGTQYLVVDWDQPVTATGDATFLNASIPLEDQAGSPAGSALLEATMVPVGAPTEYDSSRTGNLLWLLRGQDQRLAVTGGSLTIGEVVIPLDPSVCAGTQTDLAVISTQPNVQVSSTEGVDGGCSVSDGAGHAASLNFSVWQGWYATIGFTVFAGDVPLAYGGDAGELVDGHVSIAIGGLSSFEHGYIDGSSGAVELTLVSTGEAYSYTVTSSTGTERWSGEILDVEGTLTVHGGAEFGTLEFNLAGCTGFDWTAKASYTYPKGPKPGGQVPSNDLPSGAIPLKPGSKTVVATKGASPDFEAGFECDSWPDENGDIYYLNIGYTVWYRIAGTGGPVTVDTAGSDYDTTVAVYTADGAEGWAPLPNGCVEDVELEPVGVTWQAAVTFQTEVGTWYYVQLGGYPGDQPYGTLKIAVR